MRLRCRDIVWTVVSALTIVVLSPKVAEAYMIQLAKPQDRTTVPLSQSLAFHMTQGALQTPERALWSMYPASVRGRAYGGVGGDPTHQIVGGTGW